MKLALRLAAVIAVAVAAWFAIESLATPSGGAAAPKTAEVVNRDAAADQLPPIAAEPRPSSPEVEPARAEVEIPRVEIAQPAGEPKATATLLVHVVSRETRAPLANRRLVLSAESDGSWGATHVEGSHARPGESPATDNDGRAEFEVEPGLDLQVFVNEPGLWEPTKVPALAPLERREVEIDLPIEADLTLFGRLIDADTGQPVGDGVVWLDRDNDGWVSLGSYDKDNSKIETHDAAAEIHARPDGTFELRARSWRDQFANAKANEYARVVFPISQGHGVGEPPLEVRLSRAATLDVVVLERGRASAKASVALTTDSYRIQQQEQSLLHFYFSDDPRWEVETDASGLASVTGLPPRVPLELTIHARGTLARKESAPVTLEPGERRRIEVHVGSGGSIVGRIEDSDGKPVKHCQIWRVAGEPGFEQLLRSYEPPAASSRSDEEGRFRFDDVAQGKWLVGPAPAKDGEPNAADRAAIAPFAQPVEIVEGAGEVELVLRVERGLYITGTVLDPSGSGVKDTYVSGQRVNGFMSVMERTDDEGRFTLGPLLAGEFDLEAGGMMGPHAKSATVRAPAGARDVVLRLRVGGAITGRVVDAAGAARECELSLSQPSVEFGWMQTSTRDGSIHFDGLLAGSYNIHAITSDGQIGSRVGIVVGEGETVDGVEVKLAPGARLEVRYSGERHVATYEVFAAGELCWVSSLESGSHESRVVPAGDLEIRWRTYPETSTHSERLKLAVGEKREVAWDGKP